MSVLPDKLYFRIGEVSRIVGVKPYVLRYWESEFALNPRQPNSPQRVYKRRDVELILEIKRLLHEERYTIKGAKKRIVEFKKESSKQLTFNLLDGRVKNALKAIEKELCEIQSLLK